MPSSVHYLTVSSKNKEVLLIRGEGFPSYEMRMNLGMKLGDWIQKIGDISISIAEATIKQIDGLLYNI